MSNYQIEWCKEEDDRCTGCPLIHLERIAPEVGKQTLRMIDKFGLDAVSSEMEKADANYDSYGFETMIAGTGDAIQQHDGHFGGYVLAKDAIKQIAANHSGNNF